MSENLYTRLKTENYEYFNRLFGNMLFSLLAAWGLPPALALLSGNTITLLVLIMLGGGGFVLAFLYECDRWPHKSAPFWLFTTARGVYMLAAVMILIRFPGFAIPNLPAQWLVDALALPWQPVLSLAVLLEAALWIWNTVLFFRHTRDIDRNWSQYAT